jgi:CBS domain-containing protein
MRDKRVKEIMIPLSDYATVSEEDTLAAAVKALKKAQADKTYRYKHRAVLVYGKEGQITGKVSMRSILKALEPKYRQFEQSQDSDSIGLSRFGFNLDFLNSLVENFSLWDETLEELAGKAAKLKVKTIMYTPSNGEYVDEDAPVAEAVHQFILGCHQSLLVLKDRQVVGIIRLTDIFDLVCDILE